MKMIEWNNVTPFYSWDLRPMSNVELYYVALMVNIMI